MKKPTYINYQYPGMPRETIDQFDTRHEALRMLTEYQLSDLTGRYWVSSRPCKSFREQSNDH